MNKYALSLLSLLFFCLALVPATARAHGVFIFGWEEGGNICAESYFSKRQKVKNGTVRVLDAQNALLAEGKTDADGHWCTPRPAGQNAVTLVILAGEGHRGQFTLALSPSAPARPVSEGSGSSEPTDAAPSSSPGPPAAVSAPPVPSDHAGQSESARPDREALTALIRRAVQEEVAPLRKQLAAMELQANEPGLRDIAGGIGWIVGLCGLAALLLRRKK